MSATPCQTVLHQSDCHPGAHRKGIQFETGGARQIRRTCLILQSQAVYDWWHEHAKDANPYLDLLTDMGAETVQACDSVKTLLAQE